MSHFSTIRTKLTDSNLLVKSLKDLGIQIELNSSVRGYNCEGTPAEIVARLEGDYDLGWNMSEDGTLTLISDLWGVAKKYNHIELLNSINQKYAINSSLNSIQNSKGLQTANVKVQVAV